MKKKKKQQKKKNKQKKKKKKKKKTKKTYAYIQQRIRRTRTDEQHKRIRGSVWRREVLQEEETLGEKEYAGNT